jgi:hypothetical protein
MTKDNVTGKNKDFYDLGKKIFDRLNPQGAINPKVVEHVEHVEPKREWVGLTGYEVNECAAGCHNGNSVQDAIRKAEAKLKEKNNGNN